MSLKYLLIVDFEATNADEPEIIEFPVVLVDLINGSILTQFHRFVRPTENPILTDVIKKLTGIDQNQLSGSNPLNVVLTEFKAWLEKMVNMYNLRLPGSHSSVNCAFGSWGDYDFKRFLVPELQRKRQSVPVHFQKCIDVRSFFEHKYPNNQNKSLENALTITGQNFKGRPHSGIDDATNLARLAITLSKAVNFSL